MEPRWDYLTSYDHPQDRSSRSLKLCHWQCELLLKCIKPGAQLFIKHTSSDTLSLSGFHLVPLMQKGILVGRKPLLLYTKDCSHNQNTLCMGPSCVLPVVHREAVVLNGLGWREMGRENSVRFRSLSWVWGGMVQRWHRSAGWRWRVGGPHSHLWLLIIGTISKGK